VLAAVFVAEIGDIHRFAGAPLLCSWAGLTPRHHQSDTTVRRRPITKQGPRLVRWAAVEATQQLPSGSKQAAWFHRIAGRRGTSRRPRRRRPQAAHPGLLRSPRRPAALPGANAKAGDVNRSDAAQARAGVGHDPHPAAWSPVCCARPAAAAQLLARLRGEGMTGTEPRAAHGQRLLAMELPPPWTLPEGGSATPATASLLRLHPASALNGPKVVRPRCAAGAPP
jgi:Transposase IS116/IS110/IS902 family